ncbi:unnamed protein product, partial [Rotaria sp. Silwood1]
KHKAFPIAQIRTVKANDSIGYNRISVVARNSKIATVRIGYADGLSRSLSNGKGFMFLHNKLAPIIGSVCMDMTMIDITDIPEATENDIVEIFGKSLPVQDIAKWSNTIAYETLRVRGMNFLFAWRYFKSKKTTNAINIIAWVSVIAIAVVTAAIIIVLSVFNGFEGLVKGLYTDFYADIKISSANTKTINITKDKLESFKKLSGITNYSCVAEEKAVLLNNGYQSIVVLKGVDENYTIVNNIKSYIKRGEFATGNAEQPQLIVGAGIENAAAIETERSTQKLLVYLPNRKRTTSITSLESFNSSTIQPVGTFLVQQEFDNKYGFTNLAFVKYMLDMSVDEYSSIEIKLNNNAKPEEVKKLLQQALSKGFKVETRYEQNASLFKIMQVEKWFIYALLSLIMLIAAFNIVGALTMLVLEKQKDIHILKAMGASNQLIQKIFLTEGVLLAVIGGIIGIALATIICIIQQQFHLIKLQGGTFIIDYYPITMQPLDFLLTSATIVVIAFTAAFFPTKAQFPAPYCSEVYNTNAEPITYVSIAGIANASPDATGGVEHEDYTGITTDLIEGRAYTIRVCGNTDGNYTDYVSVFVDWNQDSDFDDAGEIFKIGGITNSDGLDTTAGVTGAIIVPIGATLGNTRFRVVKHYSTYQNPCNPNAFGNYGEAEDYTVNILASPSCSGTPPVTQASGPSSYCTDSMVSVTISGITAGTGLTYQWQSSPIGTNTWTNVAGATSATATFTHPSGGRDYRCVVTCTSSTQSSNSSIITIQSLNCAPPLNDEACDAMTLVLDGPADCQNSIYATDNSTDPSFTCSTPNNTIWYKYTPATTGVVQFTFKTPDTLGLNGWLGVYTASGSCPGGLTFTDVTNNTLGSCMSFGNDTITKIPATLDAGVEYYFMVDGVSGAVGNYCISIQTPPPAPATCATNISPADAAVDVSAPNTLIKWTPVATATSYDVYFGTVNPPTTKITTTSLDSILVTGLAYTTTYYWYVVPKNLGGSPTGCDANTTSFTTMATPPPPNNDECDSAINIVAGASVAGSTISATQSMAGQTCSGFTGTADDDIWFTFTATQSGDADVTLVPIGTSFDAVVIVYSGDCSTLTQIGCADTSFGGGTEIVHLTGLNAGETYLFRVYSYSSSITGQGTFNVSIDGSAVLPVSLTQFSGEKKGTSNLLIWTTATEHNNKGFELQRSYNGNDFLKMNFIESKATNGNSATTLNYQFIDTKPFAGTTYYRLKQIDLNGKTNLSNVVAIKGDKVTNLTVTDVYPNPTAKLLNVVISSPVDDKVNIVVTDITGKVVKTQSAQIAVGNNNSQIDVSNLATGTYLMKVMCSNGCTSTTTKFVKQ